MHETYALCKLVPGDLVEMRAAMLLHIFLDKLTEMILRPITPCETGETEARWQQAPVREIVDRRQQFLRARSPVTPKITIEHGPAMRGSLRSRGSRNGLTQGESPGVCVVCSVIVFIVIPGRGAGSRLFSPSLYACACAMQTHGEYACGSRWLAFVNRIPRNAYCGRLHCVQLTRYGPEAYGLASRQVARAGSLHR